MYSERKMSVGGCCVRRMIWAPREASAEVTWAPMPDVPPCFSPRGNILVLMGNWGWG